MQAVRITTENAGESGGKKVWRKKGGNVSIEISTKKPSVEDPEVEHNRSKLVGRGGKG